MKHRFDKIIIVTIALVFSGIHLFAQIPNEIVSSLKSGNANKLSEYFNQTIEMVVLKNDDVYSKAQAQQIISSFFSQNKAKGFSIIHKGGKDGSSYAIGNLSTNTGTFRVYFLIKEAKDKAYIHQLRIEKQ